MQNEMYFFLTINTTSSSIYIILSLVCYCANLRLNITPVLSQYTFKDGITALLGVHVCFCLTDIVGELRAVRERYCIRWQHTL